ncbi:MAG: recombinase family protein [Comamonadaceae bacterium]|nr:MAG: recombinase family protein [Comamonadaceae bacterium]
MTSTRPKAYSYLRFSTAEQMHGDSRRRQTDLATLYAAKHGLDLDTTSFQDLGVSAFRGDNARTGALAAFNNYVQTGVIAPGSYLLMESLDRLSRGDIVMAQGLLMTIVAAGIIVVTLQPGSERIYSRESLGQNPTELIIAIVELMRAHSESAVKSSRLKEAWKAKRNDITTKPLTSIAPAWLRLRADRTGFEVIEPRGQVVQRIFKKYLSGVGQESIAEQLNRDGVEPFGRGLHWRRSYIAKILINPAVMGTFTPHEEMTALGRTRRIPCEPVLNYFPAVVDEQTFKSAQAMRGESSGAPARPPKSGVKHLLAGLAKCPLCGQTMTRISKGTSSKAGPPYLVCTKAKEGAGCTYKAVRVENVHHALVSNASFIAGSAPSGLTDLDQQLEAAIAYRESVEDAQGHLVEALSRGDSPAIRRKLDALQKEHDEATRRVNTLSSEMVTKGSVFVAKGIEEVEAALLSDSPLDVPRANAALRRVLQAAIVNYQGGMLELVWKQGGRTEVTFAWPQDVTGPC